MRVTVRFHDGTRAEALILAADGKLARVVVAGRPDAEEWPILDGRLYDQTWQLLEIEAMFVLEGLDCADVCAELFPRKSTAE